MTRRSALRAKPGRTVRGIRFLAAMLWSPYHYTGGRPPKLLRVALDLAVIAILLSGLPGGK